MADNALTRLSQILRQTSQDFGNIAEREEAAKRYKEELGLKKDALAQKKAESQSRIRESNIGRFMQIDLASYHDDLRELGRQAQAGNKEMADLLKKDLDNRAISLDQKARELGLTIPMPNTERAIALAKSDADAFSKVMEFAIDPTRLEDDAPVAAKNARFLFGDNTKAATFIAERSKTAKAYQEQQRARRQEEAAAARLRSPEGAPVTPEEAELRFQGKQELRGSTFVDRPATGTGAAKDAADLERANKSLTEFEDTFNKAFSSIDSAIDKLPWPISSSLKKARDAGTLPSFLSENPIAGAAIPEIAALSSQRDVVAIQFAKVYDSGNIPDDMIKRYRETVLPRLLTSKKSADKVFKELHDLANAATKGSEAIRAVAKKTFVEQGILEKDQELPTKGPGPGTIVSQGGKTYEIQEDGSAVEVSSGGGA